MRILLIMPIFPPQPSVGALRAHSLAREWTAAGEEVTVLTTVKQPDQSGWSRSCEGFGVVELPYRIPAWLRRLRQVHKHDEAAERNSAGRSSASSSSPRRWLVRRARRFRERTGVFGAVRMPDLTDAWVRPAAQWAIEHGPWDVVYSSAGPYTAHLAALRVKQAGCTRVWAAEFRDLWVDNPIARGLFPFTLRERRRQRECLDAADLVVTVSDPLRNVLQRQTAAPVHVVYNGFDAETSSVLPDESVFPEDGCVRLVFTGTLYAGAQRTGPLLEAMGRLRGDEADLAARVRLVVAGASGAQWVREAERHDVGDLIENRGVVSRDDAQRMQRDADALVLVDFGSTGGGAMTTKAFEYLSQSAPILLVGGSDDTPLSRLVHDAGRGWRLGDDVDRIEATLRDLLNGCAPRLDRRDEVIRRYSREHQARAALEVLRCASPPLR